MHRKRAGSGRPIGTLQSGEPYHAAMGRMRYDGDGVQCHLCGRWFKKVGGSHLIAVNHPEVPRHVPSVREGFDGAPETAERKRASMLEQFESGERERKAHVPPGPPTVGRWHSLAVLFPDLLLEWHPNRGGRNSPRWRPPSPSACADSGSSDDVQFIGKSKRRLR